MRTLLIGAVLSVALAPPAYCCTGEVESPPMTQEELARSLYLQAQNARDMALHYTEREQNRWLTTARFLEQQSLLAFVGKLSPSPGVVLHDTCNTGEAKGPS
jgi:hypothetical protein